MRKFTGVDAIARILDQLEEKEHMLCIDQAVEAAKSAQEGGRGEHSTESIRLRNAIHNVREVRQRIEDELVGAIAEIFESVNADVRRVLE
jgi:hypothetical protein